MRHTIETLPTVAIIGAGFSGTLTAVNLLRQAGRKNLKILLLDSATEFCRGKAYSACDSDMLLNVPAGNMSALRDQPNHFLDYCKTINGDYHAGSFVSRHIYGSYLQFTLAEAEKNSGCVVQKINKEVVSLRANNQKIILELIDQEIDEGILEADQVILALGHFLPRKLGGIPDNLPAGRYIADPWDFSAIDALTDKNPVLVVGSGHTAIDTLIRLTNANKNDVNQINNRQIIFLSRRGLLPHPHRAESKAPLVGDFPDFLQGISFTVRGLMRAVRGETARQRADGVDWRDVLNILRPHIPQIWAALPEAERRKFLSRVVPFWDIHRHRLAPATYRHLESLMASGKLTVMAGKIAAVKERSHDLDITITAKGTAENIPVAAIINGTGPNYDIESIVAPLITRLRDAGMITQDKLKIGLQVDEKYQVIGRTGTPTETIHYLGPMLRARYWEAIAVPELRVHAHRLAGIVLEKLFRRD
jgi:uncharacterized NAD(P)/FAD-binding protein YdhS